VRAICDHASDPESASLRGNWPKSANFSLGAICLGPRIIALDSPAKFDEISEDIAHVNRQMVQLGKFFLRPLHVRIPTRHRGRELRKWFDKQAREKQAQVIRDAINGVEELLLAEAKA